MTDKSVERNCDWKLSCIGRRWQIKNQFNLDNKLWNSQDEIWRSYDDDASAKTFTIALFENATDNLREEIFLFKNDIEFNTQKKYEFLV